MNGESIDSENTSFLSSSSGKFRAFATAGICRSAESRLMCGSSPLPEAITRSEGIEPVTPASLRALVLLATNPRRTGVVGPKLDPPEKFGLYPLPLAEGLLWKY